MKKLMVLTVLCAAMASEVTAVAVDSHEARLARVAAVADGMCSITNVVTLGTSGVVRIDFVLKSEPGSDIRCRAELPPPERWDGRMWGQGNSSYGGKVPNISRFPRRNTAAVTTDIGTGHVLGRGVKPMEWPLAVRRDYSWRSTHLMTVYGKRFVEAYYGRPPERSYFVGGSCGGRQAFSEAIRYPDDYDGIFTNLPANNHMVNRLSIWHLWNQAHDSAGNLLFTEEEMKVVAAAAIECRAATDPKPYAGLYLADGRVSAEELDMMLALAAKKAPSLRQGDKLARLKAIHSPLVVDGECVSLGFAPGTYLGKNMTREPLSRDLREMLSLARNDGPRYNANSVDLSAFFARGGKLIVTTGWEDQTVSPLPIVDHYERLCAHEGGLENTLRHCRLFCAPGRAHGGGKGRVKLKGPDEAFAMKALIAWVEKGIAPEKITVTDRILNRSFPVAVYPGLFVQDENGGWARVERPRSTPQLSDSMFACDVAPWNAASEETLKMRNVAHRGMWKNKGIPQNTVESIKLAYDSGATWVETDFHMTKYGQIICIHVASDLRKQTGIEKKIAELTPEDVATINLGAKLKTDKVFRIPLLHQVLAVVPKHGVLQAEIKGYTKDYADMFDKAVKEAELSETNIVVSSFNYDALKDFRKRYPKYRTLWLTTIPKGKQYADVVQEQIAKGKAAKFDILCPGGVFAARIAETEADAVRAAGFDFRLWGVNSEEELRQAKRLKATGFTCNYWREAFDWANKIGGITLLK